MSLSVKGFLIVLNFYSNLYWVICSCGISSSEEISSITGISILSFFYPGGELVLLAKVANY